jgi:hypothetical protein
LDTKTKTNQLIVRRAFNDAGVAHEIVNLPPSKTYNKDVMDYAKDVDADIIAAAYFKEGVLPSPNSFIQGMIENEYDIPLLTVNSEELTVINSNYSFMSV